MAITVGNAIKNRATNEEILAILKELPNPNQDDDDGQWSLMSPTKDKHPAVHQREVGEFRNVRRHSASGFVCSPPSDEGETFNPLKVDVFLQTLLSVASKSFSHSFSALGK